MKIVLMYFDSTDYGNKGGEVVWLVSIQVYEMGFGHKNGRIHKHLHYALFFPPKI